VKPKLKNTVVRRKGAIIPKERIPPKWQLKGLVSV
jgi:hypothetical protein